MILGGVFLGHRVPRRQFAYLIIAIALFAIIPAVLGSQLIHTPPYVKLVQKIDSGTAITSYPNEVVSAGAGYLLCLAGLLVRS